MSRDAWLQHPLLDGFTHGFGTRDGAPPPALVRVRQVHGRDVLRAEDATSAVLGDADAIVCDAPGVAIGIVTADCVPILIAAPSGAVAAVHAGWRGLAAGVIGSALDALAAIASDGSRAAAVIGPHIGASCYEVDGPVVEALRARFGDVVESACRSTRPGHWQIELARLARRDLELSGLAPQRIGAIGDVCTACDRERFHSHRRDGAAAGRLVHFITAGSTASNGS